MRRFIKAFLFAFFLSSNLHAVDLEMRNSFEIFSKTFRKSNFQGTPAYDVVGLLATIRPDLFGEKAPSKKEAVLHPEGLLKKIVLKDTHPDQLSFLFSDSELAKARLPHNLFIISDFREECDDEVTALLANRLKKLGVNVSFLFTTDEFKEGVAQYQFWSSDLPSAHFQVAPVYSAETLPPLAELFTSVAGPSTRNVILQIGPIHTKKKQGALIMEKLLSEDGLASVKYEHFLLGEFTTTLNSQRDAVESTQAIAKYSKETVVVDTERGAACFKFTHNALAKLFGSKHDIINHVIKIAWRNTIGRADPSVGKFIAHLVAATDEGSNFMMVANLVDQLNAAGVAPVHTIKPEDQVKARGLAKTYVKALQTQGADFFKLKVAADGTTNARGEVSTEEIEAGYVYILENMKAYFNTPIEFWKSGKSEEWEPQWDFPSLEDRPAAHGLGYEFKVTLPVETSSTKEEGGAAR